MTMRPDYTVLKRYCRSEKPLLPVIAGPTASGKTACGVALAELIDAEVVSADSMQIYRGMDILSAKPTPEEMHGVAHHMLGIADPSVKYSADAYRVQANACIHDIINRDRVPLLCGGTGLYIDAVTKPMSFSQKSDEALHARLLEMAAEPGGKQRLHDRLAQVDPDSAARLHVNDVRRVARALEVYEATGMTLTEHSRRDQARKGDYREIIFALQWPKDALYQRIDRRVEQMVDAGLIAEVERLMADPSRHPTAFQAIGYKEIAAALRGEMSMEQAIYETKKATCALAKRQMTWFRRDGRVIWLDATGADAQELASQMGQMILAQLAP